MNPDPKQRPTLEDLLRLKRAEAPSEQFWTRFELELREKQLAAIVEKRPWWCAFPRAYVFALRHNLQIGSVAALSLVVLVSYHEVRTSQYGMLSDDGAVVARATPRNSPAVVASAEAPVGRPAAAAPDRTIAAQASASNVQEVPHGIPTEVEQATPSERLIAANLAAARTSGRIFSSGLAGFPTGFEAQVASVTTPSQAEEPLAQMSTPWDERRSRLMAGPLPASATDSDVPSHIGERLASRLSDDRLYESLSRYGVDNGGVSIKF